MPTSRLPLPSAATPIAQLPISFFVSLSFSLALPSLLNQGIVPSFLQFDQLEQIL